MSRSRLLVAVALSSVVGCAIDRHEREAIRALVLKDHLAWVCARIDLRDERREVFDLTVEDRAPSPELLESLAGWNVDWRSSTGADGEATRVWIIGPDRDLFGRLRVLVGSDSGGPFGWGLHEYEYRITNEGSWRVLGRRRTIPFF